MNAQPTRITATARATRRARVAARSRESVIAFALAASLPLLLFLFAGRASAQGFVISLPVEQEIFAEPKLLPGAFAGAPAVYGAARRFAPGWKATYGIGDADDTALSSAFLRLEELRHRDDFEDRTSRENWRHFLGVEYEPLAGFSMLGGIAKSSGVNGKKGIALQPTGYERLRLNSGLRWRGETWGLDGMFSFIPTGAVRFTGDHGYMPGTGDSGSTWLFALTLSRHF